MSDQNLQEMDDLVTLWEQMGASTGSFIGKTIGLTAQYWLQTFEQTVINPLKQYGESTEPPSSDTGVSSDIREQTWREMGKQYGESVGQSIGLSMDLLINSLKTTASSTLAGFNEPTRTEKSDQETSPE